MFSVGFYETDRRNSDVSSVTHLLSACFSLSMSSSSFSRCSVLHTHGIFYMDTCYGVEAVEMVPDHFSDWCTGPTDRSRGVYHSSTPGGSSESINGEEGQGNSSDYVKCKEKVTDTHAGKSVAKVKTRETKEWDKTH